MKTLFALFALCAVSFAEPVVAGGDATPKALLSAELIQGEVPKEWEKDKLYILECWATWCGPCIKMIPHMNELHKEYKDKGLSVIGVNVREDDKEKVATFVKRKGEGMAYPIVYVGKDGEFVKEWLSGPDTIGIPRAFVVKNGKLLFHINPGVLKKEVIESLLAGGEKEAQTVKIMQAVAQQMAKQVEIMKDPKQQKIMAFRKDVLFPLVTKKDYAKATTEAEIFIKANAALSEADKCSLLFSAKISQFIENMDADGSSKFIDELATQFPNSMIGSDPDKMKASVNMRIDRKKKEKEPNAE
jgi:thiol-disulfide isomerase/thioredoxin